MALITAPYLSPRYIFKGIKVSATCTKSSTVNLDVYIDPAIYPYGAYCNGAKLITKNAEFGDSIIIQCVDKDNVTGYGAGTVLGQYCDWYVDPTGSQESVLEYGDLIPPYFYMRLIYTSVGTVNDVNVFTNFFMHQLD